MKDYAALGAKSFRNDYKTIFLNYKRYGETILDVDLKEEEREIREIMLKSETVEDYENNMNSAWVKKYQFVITKWADLEYAYGLFCSKDEIFVKSVVADKLYEHRIVLSDEFAELLQPYVHWDNDYTVFVKTHGHLYILKLEPGEKNKLSKISINSYRYDDKCLIIDE